MKFNKNTAQGPIYVCTVCLQMWFHTSVYCISTIRWKTDNAKKIFQECTQEYTSVRGKQWICNTCKTSLQRGFWPKLSVVNGLGFPPQPEELKLLGMEEHVVSPRMLFFQMRSHHLGGRVQVTGNVVNVAVDVAPTVKLLPRSLDDFQTVSVKYKRKLEYKRAVFHENVRPAAIWKAIHYLIRNSSLFQDVGIQLNTDWLDKEYDKKVESDENKDQNDLSIQKILPHESVENLEEKCKDTDKSVSEHNINENHIHSSQSVFNIDVEEIDESQSIIQRDTLLHEMPTHPLEHDDRKVSLTFAPGEGLIPLSIFNDPDVEYLAFPTIFCGERRRPNKYKISYSDICKYELRSVDRRVAKNIPNIFFKFKKVQLKSVMAKKSLSIRRCKTLGKKISAAQVLNDDERAKIVRLDDGYYIFKDIRNSPAYLALKKKEAFAMIRQLGFPSLFISQSAAETKWPELLRALGQTVHNKLYTNEEIDNMDFQTKSELIRGDSATLVRYFDHRFNTFLKDVVLSSCNPIGEVTDYFLRKEFATRGAIHVHWFAYLKNAPVYQEATNLQIAEYYNKIISCSSDVPEKYKEYLQYQYHRHSKSCRSNRNKVCRFSFPKPPMPKSCVLEPFSTAEQEDEERGKILWPSIRKYLEDLGLGTNIEMTYHEMLHELNITHEDYILAVRSTISRAQFFLMRKPCEIRLNNYMRNCLHIWRANHDIQPCLHPYAVVQYILSYVTKAQKGMSLQMENACNEARRNNMELKESVRHIGNVFLNGVETGQEEAAFLLLQIPMTFMTRECIFINTSPAEERTFLVKDKKSLEQMDPQSTDIQVDNIVQRYCRRPPEMESYTLADFATKVNTSSVQKHIVVKQKNNVICTSSEGTVYLLRKKQKILRYVNYNKDRDEENYYRERLMLFHPWRNEHINLNSQNMSFKQKYLLHKAQITKVQIQYEKFADDLSDAVENGEEYVQSCDDCTEEENIATCGFFDPERAEHLKKYDLGLDMGISNKRCKVVYNTDVDCSGLHMNDVEYKDVMQCLNTKQYELCTHVMHKIHDTKEQMCIFIEGGAGVGKTLLGRALSETITRYYRRQPGSVDAHQHVLIIAPTGIAAYHIKGTTFHTGLHIPINQKDLKPLSHSERNMLRAKLLNVKFIFIDEISMVGCGLFQKANNRLQEIFDCKKVFGGRHVIAIGDFYQMRPVKDSYIFRNSVHHYSPMAPNIWCSHFKMFSLTDIMRQKDEKQFCEVLNRLRKGQCTHEDDELFTAQIVKNNSPEYKQQARHIFPFRSAVNQHNATIFQKAIDYKITIDCEDIVCDNPINDDRVKCLFVLKNKDKYSEISGLLRSLNAAVNCVYILSCNLCTDDGLINGAICTIRYIDYKYSTKKNIPSVIWVQFNESEVGQLQRHHYRDYYTDGISTCWTPIFIQKRETVVLNAKVIRVQFPLIPAAAVTIHKCQGSTLESVCIDMDVSPSPDFVKKPALAMAFYQHAHYVAASRVKSIKGLQILNWSPDLVSVNKDVEEHMKFMADNNTLQLCYTPVYTYNRPYKCSFLNTRSLHLHKNDIASNHTLMESNIVLLAETQLTSCDDDKEYALDGFRQIIRCDEPCPKNLRPHHGIAGYVQHELSIIETQKYQTKHFESLTMCIHKPGCIEPVQFICIYVSPKISWSMLHRNIEKVMTSVDMIGARCVILGDFNMKSISQQKTAYNSSLIQFMAKNYNLKQIVTEGTTVNGSILDLCFVNVHNPVCVITWNHWSDHKIVTCVF